MTGEDWYRNGDWNDEIASAFEAKLARSRDQKPQYLRIQGSLLKDSHPAVALQLLDRCVAEGDPAFIAHALLESAHALYVMGEIDRSLDRLEAVLDQQSREPMFRTSAAFDYAMLVTLHRRVSRYDRAWAALDEAGEGFFPVMVFQAAAARALILEHRGEAALAQQQALKARAAQSVRTGWVPGHPGVGVAPVGTDSYSRQIGVIAGR